MSAPGFGDHDHTQCVKTALAQADARAKRDKLRLTPVRRRVLEILLEDHRALGAYDILARLREDGFSAQPPIAYRALDFLTKHRFAHRIERLNAYIACTEADGSHDPIFMICRSCDAVAEVGAGATAKHLAKTAASIGFSIERQMLEVEGLCPDCKETRP